jgi:uncharacterized protein
MSDCGRGDGVEEMTFRSEGVDCVARVYRPDVAPGEATPCVVMANGFGLTRDDGLPAFAGRFAGEGITALTFDFRRLGGSGGEPRQVIDIDRQRADFGAASPTCAPIAKTSLACSPTRVCTPMP